MELLLAGIPSWFSLLDPKAYTSPDLVRIKEWLEPAATICTMSLKFGIRAGLCSIPREMRPNYPSSLLPQEKTLPYVSSSRVCLPPAEAWTMPTSPRFTCNGANWSLSTAGTPRAPNAPSPQVYTSPVCEHATVCRCPHDTLWIPAEILIKLSTKTGEFLLLIFWSPIPN